MKNNKLPASGAEDTASIRSVRSTRSTQQPIATGFDEPESAFHRLAQGITEVVKDTAPAAIGKVITNPESEQYATLVDKVSERIWTRYLDPNIEDSPLPLMVQTLVVTELGDSAPPTGTVPTPGPHLGLTDRAVPSQNFPPTENLNNQPEETRSRTVFLPVAGGAPDPDDEGGPSADEDPHRNGRGRRDKHGRSARNGAKDSGKRPKSYDSDDDESDHGRIRRKKGAKKRKVRMTVPIRMGQTAS